MLEALKLLLSSDPPASRGLPGGAPGDPAAPAPTAARRALLAAQALARLGAQGLPVDAEVLAAALAFFAGGGGGGAVDCDRLAAVDAGRAAGAR